MLEEKMTELKKVGVFSVAKIFAVISLIIGLLVGIIVLIFGGIATIFMPQAAYAAGAGIVVIIFTAVGGAIGGFIYGAIAAFIYNLAAGWFGGIEVELV